MERFYIPHGGDSQKTKAPARNADPRRATFFQVVFSQKTKAPARNADPRRTTFSRSCFFQKTKAPARNADPRRIACVSHLSSRRHGRGKKLFTLLGPNCHPGGQICCGADFGSRIKISGHPLGQSASFFEIYPFRLVQGGRGGARDKIHRSRRGRGGAASPIQRFAQIQI